MKIEKLKTRFFNGSWINNIKEFFSKINEIIDKVNDVEPIPQENADWNSTGGVSEILNKPVLADVAISGDYSDLANTPPPLTVGVNQIAYGNAVDGELTSNFLFVRDTLGNIGIGNNAPVVKLHVAGSILADGLRSADVAIGTYDLLPGLTNEIQTFFNTTSKHLLMQYSNGGYVSIGNILNPTAKLHIKIDNDLNSQYALKVDSLSNNLLHLINDGHCKINGMNVDYGGGLSPFNVAIGFGALNSNTALRNVAIGWNAQNVDNGGNNTSVGYATLKNNTGGRNTAIGSSALFVNTTGSNNIAVGSEALSGNTVGASNIAIGAYNTFTTNTNGNYNIAFGDYALANQNGVDGNIGIGFASLLTNTTGFQNVGVGFNSLRLNVGGAGNVALGFEAGYNNLGNFNTYLGSKTDASSNISNSTAIGYGVVLTNSNTVILGNNANVGIGLTEPIAKLHTNGSTSDSSFFSAIFGNYSNIDLFKVRNDGVVIVPVMPTSSAGLPSGSLWNDAGTVKIV